jgi:hypothetical protein
MPSVKRSPRKALCGQAWAEKIGSGASGVGHATTPARPNAAGGIDFSSRTVQVAGAFSLRGTRPTTSSATGRSGALALASWASQRGRLSLRPWIEIGNWSSRTQYYARQTSGPLPPPAASARGGSLTTPSFRCTWRQACGPSEAPCSSRHFAINGERRGDLDTAEQALA